MQQKKTTKEEYQKCVNVVVEYINQHLGEDIDLKSVSYTHLDVYKRQGLSYTSITQIQC